jgi:hypothetical protein
MDELIAYTQSIIDYLETSGPSLNFASQQALAELLQSVMATIQEEAATEGGTIAPPPPRAPPPGMPSSNVAGMDYDDKTGNLMVQFLGKYPNREGPIYQYPQTPRVIAELLQSGAVPARTDGQNRWGKWWKGKAPSAGASVFALLKNRNAPYQRLT